MHSEEPKIEKPYRIGIWVVYLKDFKGLKSKFKFVREVSQAEYDSIFDRLSELQLMQLTDPRKGHWATRQIQQLLKLPFPIADVNVTCFEDGEELEA